MHKSAVSFGIDGDDTKGKEAVMVVLANNPGPTFNNVEASMSSMMVLTEGIMLASVVSPCELMVLTVGITLAGAISPCGS